jgi:hypothetical protein
VLTNCAKIELKANGLNSRGLSAECFYGRYFSSDCHLSYEAFLIGFAAFPARPRSPHSAKTLPRRPSRTRKLLGWKIYPSSSTNARAFTSSFLNTPPGKFKDLPRSEISGDLPHPSGRGRITCSAAGIRTISNGEPTETECHDRVAVVLETISAENLQKMGISAGTAGDFQQFLSCVYRKSNPAILMMQSAQDRTAENASGCLDGT